MDATDMARVVDSFADAAACAAEAGFDAVEIHLGHGYLLSQFLSPATNRRRDDHGGSLENRARLPLAVVRRVCERVDGRIAVLVKLNGTDGFAGGLELDDSTRLASMLETAGAHALVISGGFTSKNALYLLRGERPLAAMIRVERSALQRVALRMLGKWVLRTYPFEEMFFLPQASAIRDVVEIPTVLLGGVVSRANLDRAMAEGFEFVAMGRALIADPDLPNRMARGEADRTRCDACNECIAEMDDGGVRCVLDGPRKTS
jgi:2,4-dienoyl-CoA reductase-like NADH-dependent reductase (Old Yellow Enzyme family)